MSARRIAAASVSGRLATRFTRSTKATGARRRHSERTEGFIVEQGYGLVTVRHEPDPFGSLAGCMDRIDSSIRDYAAFLENVPGLDVRVTEGVGGCAVSLLVGPAA